MKCNSVDEFYAMARKLFVREGDSSKAILVDTEDVGTAFDLISQNIINIHIWDIKSYVIYGEIKDALKIRVSGTLLPDLKSGHEFAMVMSDIYFTPKSVDAILMKENDKGHPRIIFLLAMGNNNE